MIKLEKVSWVENVVHPSHALVNSPARKFARFLEVRTWANGFIQRRLQLAVPALPKSAILGR